MSLKFFLIVILGLFSAGTLSPQVASAETPLTKATVQALRNQVQLIFKSRVTRAARNADTMTPGDSLATARHSFAELRFNDSSLARIGERTLFQFVPNTRNFYLGNGTALLLIPPGQGRTNVRTPNAAAGIRGSALFVRYNEDTNTTIVGALTNSRIEVSNSDNPQAQTLKAGQMAVIVQNQIVQVYNFDLNTFYQTSELVKDLDLPLSQSTPSADPGIAAVQSETSQAAKEQTPLSGQVSENPTFVGLTPPPGVQAAVTPNPLGATTPTPSGFDRETAKTILPGSSPNPPQSPTGARPNTQGVPTLPPVSTTTPPTTLSPATAIPIPGTSTAPLPTSPGSTTPIQPTIPATPAPVTPAPTTTPGTASPVQPSIPVAPTPPSPAPAPTTPGATAPVQPSVPVTPAPPPTPVTPAPSPTPVTPTPVTPAPTTPGATAPVQPSVPVTPATPVTPALPATPATPAIPATPATPAIPATPATPTLSITTPAPRPAPALTPASSVQVTTTNTTVGVTGVQTTITTPTIVTPLTVPGQ